MWITILVMCLFLYPNMFSGYTLSLMMCLGLLMWGAFMVYNYFTRRISRKSSFGASRYAPNIITISGVCDKCSEKLTPSEHSHLTKSGMTTLQSAGVSTPPISSEDDVVTSSSEPSVENSSEGTLEIPLENSSEEHHDVLLPSDQGVGVGDL